MRTLWILPVVICVCILGPSAVSKTVAAVAEPLFDATKKTVTLSTGIEMKYVEAGTETGEVVILLHGVTDTSRSFYPTIESLLANNAALHIYALDQRGHGGSSMPPEAECAPAPEKCFRMEDSRPTWLRSWMRSG